LAPSKTPAEIVALLNSNIVAIIRSPEVARSIEEQGGLVIASGPGEVMQRLQSDIASISRLIKAANLRVLE
jgi:tripartite-type tricarboxylate transporter receptor subunit TctC